MTSAGPRPSLPFSSLPSPTPSPLVMPVMSRPLEDPVVAYIAEASVGSYLEATFESAWGVHFEDPEWSHEDGSDWCWREKWPTCRCVPLMLAVLYILRTIPRRYHLLIRLADTHVARRLADGCFNEQPEPRGEHRRCLAFSTLIPHQLDKRRDCGSQVKFVLSEDRAEERAMLLVAENLAREQLKASEWETIRKLAAEQGA